MDGVALGQRVKLMLGATGMLSGVVVDSAGSPVDDVVLEAEDRAQDLSRNERLFRTRGKFTFRDLPAGTYRLMASAGQYREMVLRQMRATEGADTLRDDSFVDA